MNSYLLCCTVPERCTFFLGTCYQNELLFAVLYCAWKVYLFPRYYTMAESSHSQDSGLAGVEKRAHPPPSEEGESDEAAAAGFLEASRVSKGGRFPGEDGSSYLLNVVLLRMRKASPARTG